MAAKVIVACGSGVATSRMVAVKIDKLLQQAGVEAEVCAVDVASLDRALKDADAYVAVVQSEKTYDVPTFNGVAFLTGMGQDQELARLVECIKDK